MQPYNWNFTEVRASLTKDLVANGMEYKMLDGEFGKMEDPYTYGAEYELYDKNEKNYQSRNCRWRRDYIL